MSYILPCLFLLGACGTVLAIVGGLCNLVTKLFGISTWELFVASVGLSIGAFFIGVVVGLARREDKDAIRSGR